MPDTPPFCFFFFNDTATTEIYTLSLHDALPIALPQRPAHALPGPRHALAPCGGPAVRADHAGLDLQRPDVHEPPAPVRHGHATTAHGPGAAGPSAPGRSGERRVGGEGRSRWVA